MKTTNSKTVFVEYSTSKKGQHFITVMQNTNGYRKVIGRIYRIYNAEKQKTNYVATDRSNNQLFHDTPDLVGLKKKFIENGRVLSYVTPNDPNVEHEKDLDSYSEKRRGELEEIRNKEKEKNKEKGMER